MNDTLGVINILLAVINVALVASDRRLWWHAFAGGFCLATGLFLLLK